MLISRTRRTLAAVTATLGMTFTMNVSAQAAPSTLPHWAASTEVQALHSPLAMTDTCPQVTAQLAALAEQGYGAAACTTPVDPSAQHAAQAQMASIALPSWCTTGWRGTRIEMCETGTAALTWLDTSSGQVSGTAQFKISQDIQLDNKGRTFAENFDLQVTQVTGVLPGATLNLAVTCGGTCSATSYFPNGSPITAGADIASAISYSDSTTASNPTYSLYTLSWGQGTSTPVTWASPKYRCDNLIGGYSAGCVVPDALPVLTTMATLPNIAANIASIQQAGPNHYGRKADGLPLSRNSSLESANRAISCPSSTPRPTGQSCDEYPFASTDQGASMTAQPNWGWAWVPESEQNSQGGLLTSFYGTNRVLTGTSGSGDKYWVTV